LDPLPGRRGERHWSQADDVVEFYLKWCQQHGLAVGPPPAVPEWHYRAEYTAYVSEHPDDPLAGIAVEILCRSAPAGSRKELAAVLGEMARSNPGTLAAREAERLSRRALSQ